jgi:hypothetical protein
MEKEAGRPNIRQSGRFIMDLPKEIVEDSTYHFQITLENSGQAIWSEEEEYSLKLEGIDQAKYLISSIGNVKPFEKRTFDVYLTTRDQLGDINTQFILYRGTEAVLKSTSWKFTIVPLPSLDFKVGLFPKFSTTGQNFEVQFFDEYEQLVFKISGLAVEKGKGYIDRVENIALGRKYRVEFLKRLFTTSNIVRFSEDIMKLSLNQCCHSTFKRWSIKVE